MQNFKNVWGLYLRSQNPRLIWKDGTEKGGNGGIALLLPIFMGDRVGTGFCALCRVIMYKGHMVFLLPIVRVKNFMSLLCLKPRPKVLYAPRHLPCLVSTCVSDASTRLVGSASGSRPCLLNHLSYIIFNLLVNLIKARRWFNHWLCF